MKFVLSLFISLLANIGAALPTSPDSNAATLNTRAADDIPCENGVCVAYNQCRGTINGQLQTFFDLACSNYGKGKSQSNAGSSSGGGGAILGHS